MACLSKFSCSFFSKRKYIYKNYIFNHEKYYTIRENYENLFVLSFFCLVNYVIINYEKHYNIICLTRIYPTVSPWVVLWDLFLTVFLAPCWRSLVNIPLILCIIHFFREFVYIKFIWQIEAFDSCCGKFLDLPK